MSEDDIERDIVTVQKEIQDFPGSQETKHRMAQTPEYKLGYLQGKLAGMWSVARGVGFDLKTIKRAIQGGNQ